MPVQQTSIEAYTDLRDTGKLSRMRQLVLDGLRQYIAARGDYPTAYELFERMKADGLVHDLNDVRPKLTELKKRDMVENPKMRRTCRVTGRSVMVWRIPDPLVTPRPTPRQRKAPEPKPRRLF